MKPEGQVGYADFLRDAAEHPDVHGEILVIAKAAFRQTHAPEVKAALREAVNAVLKNGPNPENTRRANSLLEILHP
jgi:hypothetical protein